MDHGLTTPLPRSGHGEIASPVLKVQTGLNCQDPQALKRHGLPPNHKFWLSWGLRCLFLTFPGNYQYLYNCFVGAMYPIHRPGVVPVHFFRIWCMGPAVYKPQRNFGLNFPSANCCSKSSLTGPRPAIDQSTFGIASLQRNLYSWVLLQEFPNTTKGPRCN